MKGNFQSETPEVTVTHNVLHEIPVMPIIALNVEKLASNISLEPPALELVQMAPSGILSITTVMLVIQPMLSEEHVGIIITLALHV